jgi:hypothetical protein
MSVKYEWKYVFFFGKIKSPMCGMEGLTKPFDSPVDQIWLGAYDLPGHITLVVVGQGRGVGLG